MTFAPTTFTSQGMTISVHTATDKGIARCSDGMYGFAEHSLTAILTDYISDHLWKASVN